MTAQSEIDGTHITRNTSHLKDIPNDPCFQYNKNEDDEEPDENPQLKRIMIPNQPLTSIVKNHIPSGSFVNRNFVFSFIMKELKWEIKLFQIPHYLRPL